MAVPSSPTVKPAANPSTDTAAKMSAVLNELKRGHLAQESGMKKLMDTMKKDIILAGLGPVLKILDVINKLIALIIMPFTNLIMPLLLPILYFLAPIVRFLNIALRPLMVQMMDWAKGQKGKATAAAEMFKAGDITGAVSTMVGIMTEGFGMLWNGIQPYLKGVWDAVAPKIDELVGMATKKLTDIWDGVNAALADAKSGLDTWLASLKIDEHIAAIGAVIGEKIKGITDWVSGIIGAFAETAKAGLTSGITWVGGIIGKGIDLIGATVKMWWSNNVQPLIAHFQNVLDIVWNNIGAILANLSANVLSTLGGIMLTGIKDTLKGAINNAFSTQGLTGAIVGSTIGSILLPGLGTVFGTVLGAVFGKPVADVLSKIFPVKQQQQTPTSTPTSDSEDIGDGFRILANGLIVSSNSTLKTNANTNISQTSQAANMADIEQNSNTLTTAGMDAYRKQMAAEDKRYAAEKEAIARGYTADDGRLLLAQNDYDLAVKNNTIFVDMSKAFDTAMANLVNNSTKTGSEDTKEEPVDTRKLEKSIEIFGSDAKSTKINQQITTILDKNGNVIRDANAIINETARAAAIAEMNTGQPAISTSELTAPLKEFRAQASSTGAKLSADSEESKNADVKASEAAVAYYSQDTTPKDNTSSIIEQWASDTIKIFQTLPKTLEGTAAIISRWAAETSGTFMTFQSNTDAVIKQWSVDTTKTISILPDAFKRVATVFSIWADTTADIFYGSFLHVINIVKDWSSNTSKVISDLPEAFKGTVEIISAWAADTAEIFRNLPKALESTVSIMKQWATDTSKTISSLPDAFKNVASVFSTWASDTSTIFSTFQTDANSVIKQWSTDTSKIISALPEAFAGTVGIISVWAADTTQIFKDLPKALEGTSSIIKQWSTDTIAVFSTFQADADATLKQWSVDTANTISTLPDAFEGVTDTISAWTADTTKIFQSLPTALDGTATIFSNWATTTSGTFEALQSDVNSIIKQWSMDTSATISTLKVPFDNVETSINKWVVGTSKTLSALQDPLNSMYSTVDRWTSDTAQTFSTLQDPLETAKDNMVALKENGIQKYSEMYDLSKSMDKSTTRMVTLTDSAYGESGKVYISIDSGFNNVRKGLEAGLAGVASAIRAASSNNKDNGDNGDFGDFIQRPGQPAVSFHENDTIVGFKGSAPNLGGNNGSQNITIRLVDSMNNTISSQRLQAGSGANMTFTV